jgi:hypothetical protein
VVQPPRLASARSAVVASCLNVRDESWLKRVNEPLSDGDLRRLRLSLERGPPFGTEP